MNEKICVDLDLFNYVGIGRNEREKRMLKLHLEKLRNNKPHIYKGVKYCL